MNNPPCAVCRKRVSAVLIEVADAAGPSGFYVPVCAVCSEEVGDAVPPALLEPKGDAS